MSLSIYFGLMLSEIQFILNGKLVRWQADTISLFSAQPHKCCPV